MRMSDMAPISAGLIAAMVGFAGSFSVVIAGLAHVGASTAQAASGLMALSLAMGACGILLSIWTKMPVSVAWSTPGGALLATAAIPEAGFAGAVGAFLLSSALIVLAGLWRPLGRLVRAIPAALASAMLAGILFNLCIQPALALPVDPLAVGAVIATWLLTLQLRPLLAVPLATAVAIAFIVARAPALPSVETASPVPIFTMPAFSATDLIGIGIPLFVVTMASQNIPGLAILRANGYEPPVGRLLTATGLFGLPAVPFGGLGINLAALTAAICAGPEAGPDPSRRWLAGLSSGIAYVIFALTAGYVTDFAALSPVLVRTIAGLALIGAFTAGLRSMMADEEGDRRMPAAITFLVTASGVSILGISAPFWGLVAGTAMLAAPKLRAVRR